MAATFDDLIQEVIHNLSAFSQVNDAMATLDVAVTDSDTQLIVLDIGGFAQGVVQVDDELVFVQAVDSSTRTLRVLQRGFRGTKAVPHAAGALVTMSPTWPRSTVLRGITQTLRGLYPSLFAVKSVSLVASSSDWAYALPEGAERVLDVRWRQPGAAKEWERIRKYDVLWGQDKDDFPSGIALEIYDAVPSGSKIRVSYAAVPGTSAASGAYFSDITGLPESCVDLVIQGACGRLLPYLDASRLPVQTVSGAESDRTNAVGTGAQAAQVFLSLYKQRLDQEVQRVNSQYPPKFRRQR